VQAADVASIELCLSSACEACGDGSCPRFRSVACAGCIHELQLLGSGGPAAPGQSQPRRQIHCVCNQFSALSDLRGGGHDAYKLFGSAYSSSQVRISE
jgi:hypothetical protein